MTKCIATYAHRFGVSADRDAADNTARIQDAIAEGKALQRPVVFMACPDAYQFNDDLIFDGIGTGVKGLDGDVHLQVDGGGVRFESSQQSYDPTLSGVRITRTGSAGPAIYGRSFSQNSIVRWVWDNVRVDGSTGDGLVLEGTFLGTITGTNIRQCEGTGIVISNYSGVGASNAGGNSIGFFGGEVQACKIGIDLTDTRGIGLHSFASEGNDLSGLILRSDNRGFSWTGGYCENNARTVQQNNHQAGGGHADIVIGDPLGTGPAVLPNKAVKIDSVVFGDSSPGHQRAVLVGDAQQDICFISNRFNSYGGNPIHLLNGNANTSSIRGIGNNAENGAGPTGIFSANNAPDVISL